MTSDAAPPQYHEPLNDPASLRKSRDHLRQLLRKARTARERQRWRERLAVVHLELSRQEK